jgi:hypothetical protein
MAITRPEDLYSIPHEFLQKLEIWFQRVATDLRPQLSDEPWRLLDKREYRAAVISSFSLLETTLAEVLSKSDIPFGNAHAALFPSEALAPFGTRMSDS